ncbi:MAG: hypothetical protein NTV01_15390 [Bacteroidia bacterium]|nr:hypothetical protein [Bacteroidia bacterium]
MRTYILFLISMLMSNGAAGQNNSVSLTGYAVNDLNQPIDNASAKLYEMGDKDRLLDSVAINAGHFSLHYDPTSVELIEKD